MFPLEYSDAGQISKNADEAMHFMVMNKIIEGTENNELLPDTVASRAELATMLMRFNRIYG